jgi:mono/diheme cytochrome c family protein
MRVLAAWDWHRFTQFDVWGVLFWVNIIALLALVIIAIVSLVRDKQEKPASNAVAFLADDELETRRLERVLGWALVFSAVLAVSYGVYWLREPTRQQDSDVYFAEGAVERGEELFANESFESFDNATSLKCADCHGGPGLDPAVGREVVGGGGAAPYIYSDPEGTAFSVSWRAPALNTVMYRFTPDEVRDIITYGRQGTPMQAWGTDGDGPKNAQSIDDLVAYLASIQLAPEEAQKKTDADLAAAKLAAEEQLTAAEADVDAKKLALETARAERDAIEDPDSPAADLARRNVHAAGAKYSNALLKRRWAREWAERRDGITDGQLLFELNCARCHTKNFSVFDPDNSNLKPEDLLGPAGGGGSLGFSLVDVRNLRFADVLDTEGEPDKGSGRRNQNLFVTNGSEKQKPYGNLGNGSGKMPGQCNTDYFAKYDVERGTVARLLEHSGCMLTTEQIEAIVAYERCGIPATKPDHGAAVYDEDCG